MSGSMIGLEIQTLLDACASLPETQRNTTEIGYVSWQTKWMGALARGKRERGFRLFVREIREICTNWPGNAGGWMDGFTGAWNRILGN